MKFIFEDEKNWVAMKDDLDQQTLTNKITTADICLSDLDETDAHSAAKFLAARAVGTSHLSPQYLGWCAKTVLAWLVTPKENMRHTEVLRWKVYADTFLKDELTRSKIVDLFTREKVEKLLYPGVAEFYNLAGGGKYYLTRNVEPAAQAFAKYLGLNGVFAEQYDKKGFTENFVKSFPFKRYIVRGDSEDEELVYDVLKFYKNKGRGD